MKKLFICVIVLFIVTACSALADAPIRQERYVLSPGIYEVGKDIPRGHYDVRFVNMNSIAGISYSDRLTEDGKLDLDWLYSYSLLYTAQWNQGMYAVITLPDGGYLEVEYSTLAFYPED